MESPGRRFGVPNLCACTGVRAALVALGCVLAGAATAQINPNAIIPPQGTPIPQLAPPSGPAVGPGLPAAPPVAPIRGVEGSVAIRGVAVTGASVFPADRLIATAGPVVGPAVPVATLEAARAAILDLYRSQGYVFTTVDAVVDRDGQLRLAVAEGHVVEVQLDGDIGPAGTQVLRFLNRLTRLPALDTASLERGLLLASDVPGVTIRSVLRPAGTEPGALILVAQVARRAVTGYVTADNRGFRLTGPQQILGAAQFNSFTSFGERTELSLFYSAGDTQLFGQASTEFFVGDSGARVRLYAGRGRSDPSGFLRGIGYHGESSVAGVALSYPLIRQRQQTLQLSGALDLIESEISVNGADGRPTRLSFDSVRALRLGGDWSVYDLLLGEARPATNTLIARLSQGLTALGASRDSSPDASRPGVRFDFTKGNFDLTRRQALFVPWQDASVALQLTVAGQGSRDILPLAEKFYLGGARLGRGFYAGQVTGDSALAGSAELQLTTHYETTVFGLPLRTDPMLYAFFDHGWAWQNLRTDRDRRLTSTGIGTRVPLNDRFEFQLEGVHRITRRPAGDQTPDLKGEALYWRVLARF